MIAASEPVQRRPDAKLLLIRSGGSIEHWPRAVKYYSIRLARGATVLTNLVDAIPTSASLSMRSASLLINLDLWNPVTFFPQVVLNALRAAVTAKSMSFGEAEGTI